MFLRVVVICCVPKLTRTQKSQRTCGKPLSLFHCFHASVALRTRADLRD